jgi:hypothetical protein
MERPLCLDCIATKATATVADLQTAFTSIRNVLDLQRDENETCRACGTVGTVYRIDRPR